MSPGAWLRASGWNHLLVVVEAPAPHHREQRAVITRAPEGHQRSPVKPPYPTATAGTSTTARPVLLRSLGRASVSRLVYGGLGCGHTRVCYELEEERRLTYYSSTILEILLIQRRRERKEGRSVAGSKCAGEGNTKTYIHDG